MPLAERGREGEREREREREGGRGGGRERRARTRVPWAAVSAALVRGGLGCLKL